MARQRYVNTKFWSDSWVSNLDPVEKLLFIYLITNERTSICGIYELPMKYMAVETGIEKEMIEKILTRFQKDGKVLSKNGWVAVKNFAKNQQKNPKIQAGISYELSNKPKELVRFIEIDNNPAKRHPRQKISKSLRAEVMLRDNSQCVLCKSTSNLEIDHLIPVMMGGTSQKDNLRVLCQSCNGKRNAGFRWSNNGWTMGGLSHLNTNTNTNNNPKASGDTFSPILKKEKNKIYKKMGWNK